MILRKSRESSVASLKGDGSKLAQGGQGTPPPTGSSRESSERGFTLQTLIVTAVLVLVAVGAALVLVAINRSSSDDFEEAGNVGIEGKCSTWEIHLSTLEAAGHGGPEGHGGVFSSNIGCLATCYWEITDWASGGTGPGYNHHYPSAYSVRNKLDSDGNRSTAHPHVSKLHYYDDNRAPAVDQIRLGVVSLREPITKSEPSGGFNWGVTDHAPARGTPSQLRSVEIEREIKLRFRNQSDKGVRAFPGRPLTPTMIENGVLTIAKPNWLSFGDNPGGGVLATNYPDTGGAVDLARWSWEDKYWEVRADSNREVCEIVNVVHDDLLVCSSAKKKCEPSNT